MNDILTAITSGLAHNRQRLRRFFTVTDSSVRPLAAIHSDSLLRPKLLIVLAVA